MPALLPVCEAEAGFAVLQRQLADAQSRLNSQRAGSGESARASGGNGDSVLDLLREQASGQICNVPCLYSSYASDAYVPSLLVWRHESKPSLAVRTLLF